MMQEICRTGGTHMIAFQEHLGQAAKIAWHGTKDLPNKITGILEQAEGRSLQDCKAAVDRLKGEVSFFPKPAEFRKALPRTAGNDNAEAFTDRERFEKVLARKRELMIQHSRSLTKYLESFRNYNQAVAASQDIGRAVNNSEYRGQSRHFQAWVEAGGVVVEEAIDGEFPDRSWTKRNRKKASGQW